MIRHGSIACFLFHRHTQLDVCDIFHAAEQVLRRSVDHDFFRHVAHVSDKCRGSGRLRFRLLRHCNICQGMEATIAQQLTKQLQKGVTLTWKPYTGGCRRLRGGASAQSASITRRVVIGAHGCRGRCFPSLVSGRRSRPPVPGFAVKLQCPSPIVSTIAHLIPELDVHVLLRLFGGHSTHSFCIEQIGIILHS